ncbi:hypothetical protein N5C79_02330 [Pantoea brenneri]|uniref:hypothetical protein n=1 Tax=Pantoea brenneri TaxID=472694 RepID=UPI002447F326|nr:hypothetical protein [Pantoea brenneri]MDH1085327.1 hypothetical protein [Pantoea brenneri]
MNKLTADKCREWIDIFTELEKDDAISIAGESHLQAYRIALPILEQQERGDGWIEWGGGKCPVSPKTIVVVRYRKGKEESPGEAGGYFWNNTGSSVDIIAYRIIPEQPTNQNGEQ